MAEVTIPDIKLFSDGGADPNPGKGGFGVILSHKGYQKEFSQGYKLTTNNRMELMGVIFGLEQLKTKASVQVYSDSKYVVNGIEKGWAKRWKKNNWYRTKRDKAINYDLWDRLLKILDQHIVTFNWVKGHAGHLQNERCDQLASQAIRSSNLMDDEGYEGAEMAVQNSPKQNDTFNSSGAKTEKEGDKCRKCGVEVIKKPPKSKKRKPGQTYYFEYYLFCPSCKRIYLVEDARREIPPEISLFS